MDRREVSGGNRKSDSLTHILACIIANIVCVSVGNISLHTV